MTVEGQHCPGCGGAVVYNGNYMCGQEEPCGWVMEEGDRSPVNDKICMAYLQQCLREANASGQRERARLMLHYIDLLERERA